MARRKTGIRVGAVPVYASQSKYEGVIERHGQHVLWYSSQPCTCISDIGQPDPSCRVCNGVGSVHYLAKEITFDAIGTGRGGRIIPFEGLRIQKVHGAWIGNRQVTITGFTKDSVTFPEPVPRGRRVYVYLDHALVYDDTVTIERQHGTMYHIKDAGEFKRGINKVYSVYDSEGVEYNVQSYWEDRVRLEVERESLTMQASVVDPPVFAIQSVNPQEKMEKSFHEQGYDAQVTVHGFYHVGFGDLITTITPEAKDTLIGTYDGSEYTQLPYFHLGRVLRVVDSEQNEVEATVAGPSHIKWGSKRPYSGEKFSLSFTYRPTFRVMDKLPQLRNAEDKNFPKRFMVNRYDNMGGHNVLPTTQSDGTGAIDSGEILF